MERSSVMAARRPSAAHATGVPVPSGDGQPPKQTCSGPPATFSVTESTASREAGAKPGAQETSTKTAS
ncbi:MAG: hypothetical protein ACLUPV_01190 [Bilophila wadsworthia]